MMISQTRANHVLFELQCAGLIPVYKDGVEYDDRIRRALHHKVADGEMTVAQLIQALRDFRLADPVTGLRPRMQLRYT